MDRRHFVMGAGTMALGEAASTSLAPAQAASEKLILAQAPVVAAAAEKLTIEQQLANYAVALRFEELPQGVVDVVKRLLIDTLACAFGAIGAPPARIAEATFRKTFGGQEKASILGGRQLISVEGAALINGILVRYLDLNDIYVGRDPSHPSECIPAALAVCEEAGSTGRGLIEAVLIGYEAQLALVDAFSFSDRGFHSLSCAGFAVPLMAGKVWRLTRDQMVDAMGVAGPRQMTLLAINRGPISMMKAFAYANTAMDSLFATRLATAGFTGASDVVSWFAENVKGVRPDVGFTINRGSYRISKVGLKRFPLQFELQTVAEAGVKLHDGVRGRLGEIRDIIVETYPTTIERTADPSRYQPKTRETADHSLPVCLALALSQGNVTIEQFEKDEWKRDAILGLARKVKVKVSEKLMAASPRGRGAVVTVNFTDGKSLNVTVDLADGDPQRPMSRESLEGKFLQYATPHLGETGAREALNIVDHLEELTDVGALMKALRPRS